MKNTLFVLVAALGFFSCKKDAAETCTELDTQKARIAFDNTGMNLGDKSFNICNTQWTYATSEVYSGVVRNINVSAATGPTTDDKGAEIWIRLPLSFNTLNGSRTIDLSLPYTDPPFAMLQVGNPGWNLSYISSSGELTITKLSESEIEGIFQCVVKSRYSDEDPITISDGTFAGKF